MKAAGIMALVLGAVLCLSGCGYTEGAGATITVVKETPTPIPTPTPEATPTPVPTPTPELVTEQTASGITVSKVENTYVANTDVNLRVDASADSDLVAALVPGEQVKSTGICENGWIEIDYDGRTVYASGDYLTVADAGQQAAAQ